ncbi:hypothetical protein VB636_01995 [Paracoccus sp. APAP_BH8]|nr:hypothetical protein [Paracoccus pantotrophus]
MLIVESEPTGSSPVANAKIRRLHFTEGTGIKTICRGLKLSKSEA